MIDDYFDRYGRQARLLPALLALFPVFITVAVWVPALYKSAAGLVGLAVACGLLTALAHFARSRGRHLERQLIVLWGGLPTSIWLRHSSEQLEPETKARYYKFLEQHVDSWKAPTVDEERADPTTTDSRYQSAVRWLLEFTRDNQRFPLVFAENVSYGFRRNTLGLKPYAILLCVATIGVSLVGMYDVPPIQLVENLLPQLTAMVVTFTLLLWWIFAVTKSWVRDAGDAFAKAILAACDS